MSSKGRLPAGCRRKTSGGCFCDQAMSICCRCPYACLVGNSLGSPHVHCERTGKRRGHISMNLSKNKQLDIQHAWLFDQLSVFIPQATMGERAQTGERAMTQSLGRCRDSGVGGSPQELASRYLDFSRSSGSMSW